MTPCFVSGWVVGMVALYAAAHPMRVNIANRTVVDAIEEAMAIVLWPIVVPLAFLLVVCHVVRGK